MLIKSTRIQSESGPKALINHVFDKAEENEEIRVIYGDRSVVESMMQTARDMDKKYGVRHFTISSFERLTEQQRLEARQLTAQEYGFNLSDCVVVRHTKARENNAGDEQHEHLLVPEIQANGRVLDNRANRLRNEKISRQFEIQNGLRLVPGKWNQAVAKAFTQAGQHDFAEAMAEACQIERPGAAYSSEKKEELKRKGKSLPTIKTDINNIWKQSDGIKAFLSGLSESGFRLERGTKNTKSYIIYDQDNTQIGSVSRIIKDTTQNDFLKLMEDYENGIMRKEEATANKSAKKSGSLIKKTRQQDPDEYEDIDAPELRTESEDEALSRYILRSEVSTQRDQSDLRTDSKRPDRGTKSDRPNLGSTSADIIKSGTADTRNQRNVANAIAIAKINRLNSVDFHDISQVRIVTPDYLEEIKTRLKQIKTDDAEYFSNVYKNLKEQNREIWKYNKQIDHNAIALIIDAILRLLFGYTVYKEKAKPVPIQCPYFHSPIDKDIFDTMTKEQKRSVTFQCFVKARTSFRKHDNFMKKWEMTDRFPSFQAYLQSYSGDFMADEIINMYPQQYIKELEKSENITEREIGAELRKIKNGQGSEYVENYTSDDLKICIESIAGEIEEKITMQHDAEKVRIMADEQAKQWNDAIALQEDMSRWVHTPDVDFIPADIIDEEISSPRMR